MTSFPNHLGRIKEVFHPFSARENLQSPAAGDLETSVILNQLSISVVFLPVKAMHHPPVVSGLGCFPGLRPWSLQVFISRRWRPVSECLASVDWELSLNLGCDP